MEIWWFANAVLGWIFATAGCAKVVRLGPFIRDVQRVEPRLPSLPIALAVSLVEVLLGASLLAGIGARTAAISVLTFLAIFAVVEMRRRGNNVQGCGCGGLAELGGGRVHLVANLGLALIAAVVVLEEPQQGLSWLPLRYVATYVALVVILFVHLAVALKDVHHTRLQIDRQRLRG